MSTIQYKRCAKCLQEKPRDAFSKGSKYKDGLQTWCKECYSRDHMARVGKEYYPPAPDGYKRCMKCKDVFESVLDNFHADRQKSDGLNPVCKVCRMKNISEQYAKDPEKFLSRQRARQYHRTEKAKQRAKEYRAKNEDKIKTRRKKWVENNPEKDRESKKKWQDNNPDKMREKARKHRANNPEKYHAIQHTRRAKENNLPYTMTDESWAFMFEYWDNRCCVCGRCEGNGLVLARDHWIPVKDEQGRDIGTIPDNMLPLCHTREGNHKGCNNTKGNKDPIEWLYSKFPKEQADEILAKILEYFEITKEKFS